MAQDNTNLTTTSFANLIKYTYQPGIIEATRKQCALLDVLETKAGNVSYGGKSFTEAIELNYMGSTKALAEEGALPDATVGTWLNAVLPIKINAFAISVTGLSMATTKTDRDAFAEAWARQLYTNSRAFRQQINRQVCGDGNGILCQIDGAIAAQVATVDNAYGLSGYNNSDVNGHRFISANLKVDVYTGATIRGTGAWLIDSFTKGAFPSTSGTITFNSAHTVSAVADGDYVYNAGSKGNEIAGIRLLIDDNTVASTVESLSADTYSEWRSWIGYGATVGTAEALTTNRMSTLMDDIETNGGGKVDFIFTSPAVWLTYGEMARSENMICNAKTLDTGWKVIEFQGIPIFKDPYLVDNMFFVDSRALKILQAGEQGWIDFGDGPIHQKVGYDVAKADWKWYMNMAITNRAWCGKLTDISVVVNKY